MPQLPSLPYKKRWQLHCHINGQVTVKPPELCLCLCLCLCKIGWSCWRSWQVGPYIYGQLTARPSELWAVVPSLVYTQPPALYTTNHLIYHPTQPSASIWLTGINPNFTMDPSGNIGGRKWLLKKATAVLNHKITGANIRQKLNRREND